MRYVIRYYEDADEIYCEDYFDDSPELDLQFVGGSLIVCENEELIKAYNLWVLCWREED